MSIFLVKTLKIRDGWGLCPSRIVNENRLHGCVIVMLGALPYRNRKSITWVRNCNRNWWNRCNQTFSVKNALVSDFCGKKQLSMNAY